MKKILFIIFCFLGILSMSSCEDSRIRDIKGIVWQDDFFGIYATSEQLQNQTNPIDVDTADNYYSSIIIEGKNYSCVIGLQNQSFQVILMNSSINELVYFYGDTYEFIWGSYGDLVKEKDKDYKYSLLITLNNTGQYFEYCESNDLSFPKTITLYGYEEK